MRVEETYAKIECDVSGSMSKNRFRQELLWGASQMFDLFDKEDFCIVFDYKCDIEIHYNDSLEFYQIKTHKIQNPYTFNVLSKKDDTGKSILGKLYVLKDASSPECPIRIAIVSNAFFKFNKKVYSDSEILKFVDLEDKTQEKICSVLSEELNGNVTLEDVSFIYTSMNLLDPANDLRGKIVGSYEKIKNCEPAKPNALYRLVVDTVTEKACYELKINSYSEVISKKGITKNELECMLDCYSSEVDLSVSQVEEYIQRTYSSPKEIKKLKGALVRVTRDFSLSIQLNAIEIKIAQYLNKYQEELPDERDAIICLLKEEFSGEFSIEFFEEDIFVYLLLILFKWENGKYEHINIQ